MVWQAQDIHIGDYVGTKFRGGTRQGYVEEIHDGKATFTNQRGKQVTHKLTTLAKDPDRSTDKPTDEKLAEAERQRWKQEIGE